MSSQFAQKPGKLILRTLQILRGNQRLLPSSQNYFCPSPPIRHYHHQRKPFDKFSNTQSQLPQRNVGKLPVSDRSCISSETLADNWRNMASRLMSASNQTRASFSNVSNLLPNVPKGLGKPLGSVKNAFDRYREAIGLHIEGFWKTNSMFFIGALAFGICFLVWRTMIRIANLTIGISEGLAEYGLLAFASACVAFAGLYLRARYTINPDKVYRIAMRKLNTSAGILEVLGAPLSGTDVRAYVMSGGRLRLKNFKPSVSRKRCFLIFPVQGPERRGLVSVEAKKKSGKYDFKLLAVDIPMANGPDQRLFLIGNEEEYRVGGGLLSELRDPIIKAMAAEKEFEKQDDKEDDDELRRLEEMDKQKQQEVESVKIRD